MTGLSFDTIIHGFPKQSTNVNHELRSYLYRLPIIDIGEIRIKGEGDCVDFILANNSANKKNLNFLYKSSSLQTIIYRQWAKDSLLVSLLYARWKNEENFYHFSNGIKWPVHDEDILDKTEQIQSYILNRFQGHHIFDMSIETFQSNLIAQFAALENLLNHHSYIEPLNESMTLTDLNIFVVIQGFLSIDLTERSLITDRFESIMRWFSKINELTTWKAI